MITFAYAWHSVFPAPAGINRFAASLNRAPVRVPRASGDKPRIPQLRALASSCSPRQRG
ncbi:hypothetical protein G4M62_002750 [Salmonella enterica subsp. enterica]|nr:hypothetical protein [Salmonella enterica subsp. enterica serovar Kampala]